MKTSVDVQRENLPTVKIMTKRATASPFTDTRSLYIYIDGSDNDYLGLPDSEFVQAGPCYALCGGWLGIIFGRSMPISRFELSLTD